MTILISIGILLLAVIVGKLLIYIIERSTLLYIVGIIGFFIRIMQIVYCYRGGW